MGLHHINPAAPFNDPLSWSTRWRILHSLAIFLVVAAWMTSWSTAQEAPVTDEMESASIDAERPLQFSFEGARWLDVIKWLADESDLALHVGDLPVGSFSYSDPSRFSPQEAIDRINMFLLPQGFSLVRSGKLLSVINLADPRSMQQLDTIAKMVTEDELDGLPDHDVVKCIFPLSELRAEDAVDELSALNLMTTPAVFAKTNQLMITDTAAKLKNVKTILDSFKPSTLDNGTIVKSFALEHVSSEDVLQVARPHLGLATGEMIGIDVSLSSDVLGKNIFVTGVEDKVALIEGLIEAIDQPEAKPDNEEMILRSHDVAGGNLEVVYNVLQTLLAGNEIRLSMDEAANTIVALAPSDVQTEIEQTVNQLQASVPDFEVIPLKTVDPYFAISLLEEMLDLPDVYDDPDDVDPDAPKIDADPGNMRLFVRAKKHQIEQIKKIVAGLDEGGQVDTNDVIRIFPLMGSRAIEILQTAVKFWHEENPVVLFQSTVDEMSEVTERVINEDPTTKKVDEGPESGIPNAKMLTGNIHSQAPVIRCQLTPRGLLLQCDDTEALDRFENHLRTIAGPLQSASSPPTVFYLKYTKPDDAVRMLAELLDGGDAAKEGESGSLVNGYVSSPGSFLGSLVTSQDGTTTMMSGSITVVADSRLNRLIAQGSAEEMEQIEAYLRIIDKDTSITSIETYGSSHVIELRYMKADEAAAVIREAYASRISDGATSGASQQSSQPNKRDEAQGKEAAANNRPPDGKAAPARQPSRPSSRDLEPKMTIAVHEPSNSLIVIAPEQLFREVEQLVKLMDMRSAQTVQVIQLSNTATVESMMRQMFTDGLKSSGTAIPAPAAAPVRGQTPSSGTPAPVRAPTSLRSPVPSAVSPKFQVKSGR